jgi:hypothetical protein
VIELVDSNASNEEIVLLAWDLHQELLNKPVEDGEETPLQRVERRYAMWSKDMASAARKFFKMVMIMENIQDMNKLDISMLWSVTRITAWRDFWDMRTEIAANTKHNNMKSISALLKLLKMYPSLDKFQPKIETAYQ